MQGTYIELYHHLWPLSLYHILSLYLTNSMIFGGEGVQTLTVKCVSEVSLQYLSETFHILRRIHRYIILPHLYLSHHVEYRCSCHIWIFVIEFWKKKLRYRILWKSFHWKSSCSTGTAERETNKTKLKLAFHNFAKAPTTQPSTFPFLSSQNMFCMLLLISVGYYWYAFVDFCRLLLVCFCWFL